MIPDMNFYHFAIYQIAFNSSILVSAKSQNDSDYPSGDMYNYESGDCSDGGGANLGEDSHGGSR